MAFPEHPVRYESVSADEVENNVLRSTSNCHDSTPDENSDGTIVPESRVKWGIDWQVPSKMIGLLVIGMILAVGHHCLYQSLVGEKVDTSEERWHIRSQAWNLRYGQALALSAKTCFAGSVALGYQQHIWCNFRDTHYSVEGISAIFGAIDDPLSLANLEYLSRAKIGTVLALIIW